jgi:hypothetical protein
MSQPAPFSSSGNIAVTIVPQPNGSYVCELVQSIGDRTSPIQSFHGQTPKHAIAIALENLARDFRIQAEAEQEREDEAVDRSSSGKGIHKRFHVILHYERTANEETKFEAMEDTLLGNAVVENAEVSIIQVTQELPIEPWKNRHIQP